MRLRGTGKIRRFWMNSIKSFCYAQFDNAEIAEQTRKAVQGVQWPQGGKVLAAKTGAPSRCPSTLDLCACHWARQDKNLYPGSATSAPLCPPLACTVYAHDVVAWKEVAPAPAKLLRKAATGQRGGGKQTQKQKAAASAGAAHAWGSCRVRWSRTPRSPG